MTERQGHQPIAMTRKDSYRDLAQVGDFWWRRDAQLRRSLVVLLPNPREGYEYFHSSWTIDHPNRTGDQWSWDGDVEKPTLKPSLHAVGEWHGYVTAGWLEEA